MAHHLFTCQDQLLDSLTKHLEDGKGIVEAWLCACQELPGVQGLEQLKRLYPTALPSWRAWEVPPNLLVTPFLTVVSRGLMQALSCHPEQSQLEICPGNHVVFNTNLAEYSTVAVAGWRAAEREAQLERFRRCRSQEGFASEGMLCNSPPIPLRVLDYLEAADLLSLSLVCKATHLASHYLFHREEEVLNRPDIRISLLQPGYHSARDRHRAMRAASQMCGRPEALDVTRQNPSLLHNLVAGPDACTQPHFSWNDYDDTRITRIMEERRVASLGRGKRVMYRVDPGRSVSRDELQAPNRDLIRETEPDSELDPGFSLLLRVWQECITRRVKLRVEQVNQVFVTACMKNQVAFVFQAERD